MIKETVGTNVPFLYATDPADPQADIIAFLDYGNAFADCRRQTRIDTHAASVFLSGNRAWKLKRAVCFGYLDFSTPDKRRDVLEAELRLNRRTAPDLYRAVHVVTRNSNGRLAIDGGGEAVDWLLEMRRFPDEALLNAMAARGQLDDRLLMRLADRISAFHEALEPVSTRDGAGQIRRVIEGNLISMANFPDILAREKSRLLSINLLQTTAKFAPLLDARARSGRVRHAHGDLHLANIAVIDGEPTLFDCLEFSVELATIDLLYDLAFLLMDLWQRGLHTAANIVYNRYLDRSPLDEAGTALMPLFLAIRASIRAHVIAAQSVRAGNDVALAAQARDYLALAIALLEPVVPREVAIGGRSGTGKSTVARALGGWIGQPPGARILRSDVLRKQLGGVALETRLPTASYTRESSALIYATLSRLAAATLASGQSVIVDAVFAERPDRDAIEVVAKLAKAAFVGLWLEAPGSTLIDRIATRGPDASDADRTVADAQSAMQIGGLGTWQTLSTDATPDQVAAEACAKLDLKSHRRAPISCIVASGFTGKQ